MSSKDPIDRINWNFINDFSSFHPTFDMGWTFINSHQVAIVEHEGTWNVTAYPEQGMSDFTGVVRPVSEANWEETVMDFTCNSLEEALDATRGYMTAVEVAEGGLPPGTVDTSSMNDKEEKVYKTVLEKCYNSEG